MQNNLMNTTLTGVDERTSLAELKEISQSFEKIEWGILYSLTSEDNRYPSMEWLDQNVPLLKQIMIDTEQTMALHVCGRAVKILLSQEPSHVMHLLSFFNRVQINFHYKESMKEDLEKLMNNYPGTNFITQHHKSNEKLWSEIVAPNHQILFDTSGGRGIIAQEYFEPFSSKMYGYAGGLGPDNVAHELELINIVTKGQDFWIDMEGKIRTEDNFDLKKCVSVLQEVDRYKKNAPSTSFKF